MVEYTPSTEEVRVNYIGTREEFVKPWQSERPGEFDRWLNEERAKAWDEGQLNGEFYLNPYRKAD